MLSNQNLKSGIDKMLPNLIAIRRDIHQHPELGYQEFRTSKLVLGELEKIGLEVQSGVVDTGIVGVIEGNAPGPTVMLRADMDALPIQELNRVLGYASQTPGVMHACGHDAHTSILLGTVILLSQMKDQIKGRVKFLFQPAEEEARQCPGYKHPVSAATQMIEAGVLENVSAILGFHLWPDLYTGQVGIKNGAAMAGSCWFQITINGKSVHAAQPHKGLDSITAVANLINLLQLVITRNVDPSVPVLLNIGTIKGGYRRNVVADKVEMTGTVRALDQDLLEITLKERIKGTIEGLCQAIGTTFEFNYHTEVPVLYNDPKFVDVAFRKLSQLRHIVTPILIKEVALIGEDFAFYTQNTPGLFLYLGCTHPSAVERYPLHSPSFNFDEKAIGIGVAALTTSTFGILDQLSRA